MSSSEYLKRKKSSYLGNDCDKSKIILNTENISIINGITDPSITNSTGCDSITNINFTLDITSSYNSYDFNNCSD